MLTSTIERAYGFTEIRAGHLQPLRPGDMHLPINELCYFAEVSVRWRQIRSGMQSTPGRLIMTSKGVTFTAPVQGGQMPWKKIMALYPQVPNRVIIEASGAALAGAFTVPDPEWAVTMASTLVKIDRRQVLDASRAGRSAIPQHVKTEVWQRDRGACRQCGMDGSGGASLEFDHIIPVALGGATSAANLQVLCRPCNGLKGARI